LQREEKKFRMSQATSKRKSPPAKKMMWNLTKITALVEAIEKWGKSEQGNKWKEIAKLVGCTDRQASDKWHNISMPIRKEMMQEISQKETANGNEEELDSQRETLEESAEIEEEEEGEIEEPVVKKRRGGKKKLELPLDLLLRIKALISRDDQITGHFVPEENCEQPPDADALIQKQKEIEQQDIEDAQKMKAQIDGVKDQKRVYQRAAVKNEQASEAILEMAKLYREDLEEKKKERAERRKFYALAIAQLEPVHDD